MLKKTVSRVQRLVRKMLALGTLKKHVPTYRVEEALFTGVHKNTNTHPSIIHFSTNKAASQHVMSVLQRCAHFAGMTHANLNGYIFNMDIPFIDKMSAEQFAKYSHVLKPTGYLYSVFGGMIESIPEFEKYRVVLMLRDPRDVLVSNYYSMAYSHVLPAEGSSRREAFVQRRIRAQQTPLDDFVRERSAWVKSVYERYDNLLIKRYPADCYYYTTYEAMVTDYAKWLKDMLKYVELDVPVSLFDVLVQENDRSRPRKEDIHNTNRLGRSGDYLQKLSPETIAWLNEDLKGILARFGYVEAGLPRINYDV